MLQGFIKFNFKLNLKVSAFYLEKQKSFIPKKKKFLAVVNIKTKKLCLLTQFSRRFWVQFDISAHPDLKERLRNFISTLSVNQKVCELCISKSHMNFQTLKAHILTSF